MKPIHLAGITNVTDNTAEEDRKVVGNWLASVHNFEKV
jgi:hypothetical protein